MDQENSAVLVLNEDNKALKCLNRKTGLSFELNLELEATFLDHQTLPNNRVLFVSKKGWVQLLEYNYDKKAQSSMVVCRRQIELKQESKEEAVTLAVSKDFKYCAVSTWSSENRKLLRVILFEIENNSILRQIGVVDMEDKNLDHLQALAFYGKIGPKLVLTGLTSASRASVVTFAYDAISGFEECKGHTKKVDISCPRKVSLIDGSLCGVDRHGKVFKISYHH